jgi:hypothetical protein
MAKNILFSADMVRAILLGKKTQTRREIKPQPIDDTMGSSCFYDGKFTSAYRNDIFHETWTNQFILDWAKFQVGDEIYVKENFRLPVGFHKYTPSRAASLKTKPIIYYEANGVLGFGVGRFRPSLFMPEKLARIWLKITGVRLQRLWDIDNEEAIAEGIQVQEDGKNYPKYSDYPESGGPGFFFPADSFHSLWTKIYGQESTKANPWVWVYEFEVLTTTGKEAAND